MQNHTSINITEISKISKENKSNNIIVELSDEGSSQAPSIKPQRPPISIKRKPEPEVEQLSTNPVIAVYQRVDQQEMEKLGCFGHKSELDKEQGGLTSMHKFSLLQRFRTGKNLKEVDRFKPRENKEELK